MRKITILLITLLSLHIVAYAGFPVTETSNIVSEECDNIILKNGEEISAKIIEITPDLIKYKKCNNQDGPIVSINKSEVMMIKYSNGTKELVSISSKKEGATSKRELRGNNGFAIAALICGILGFVVPGLGLLSIIFGAIGLSRKGRGMALTGMILGIVNLIAVAIFYISENQ